MNLAHSPLRQSCVFMGSAKGQPHFCSASSSTVAIIGSKLIIRYKLLFDFLVERINAKLCKQADLRFVGVRIYPCMNVRRLYTRTHVRILSKHAR